MRLEDLPRSRSPESSPSPDHSTSPTPSEMALFRPNSLESDHDPSLATIIRELRLAVANWTCHWGPENLWGKRFHDELTEARNEGHCAVDAFFECWVKHVKEGRKILLDLKFAAELRVDSTFDEIRDLFLQGYEMVVGVTSEVKFFEVKLDEYCPATPSTQCSDLRCYTDL